MLILTLWLMAFHSETVLGSGYEIMYIEIHSRTLCRVTTILQLFALLAALQ